MAKAQKIMVTGGSGFIAKHIVLQLLQAGHTVRASVRSETRANELRQTMAEHLGDAKDLDSRLELTELDLNDDKGWDAALEGVDVLMHTASPFPLASPKDENDLIRPAVDGTLRALKAAKAAGVTRVVLTSSCAAIYYTVPLTTTRAVTEKDWSDPDSPVISAYSKSKTLAERAAWDFVASNPEMQLTTINPSLVAGPALDDRFGTSLGIVERALSGKDPALPALKIGVVDVRDVAKMHVAAIANKKAIGERFIASSDDLWFREVNEILKAAYPDRKITTRQAPNWMIRLFSLFDGAIRSVTPLLGKDLRASGQKARDILGVDFISGADAIRASAEYLTKR